MDQQRGRSPSMGHQQSQYKPEHSPSPHQFQDGQNSIGLGLGLDTTNSSNQQFINNGGFNSNNNIFGQQGQPYNMQGNMGDSSFNGLQYKQEDSSSFNQQQPSFTQELMGANNFEGDFPLFSTPSNGNEQLDPQFYMNELSPQSRNPSVNPNELNMSSPPNASTPPNLLQPESHTTPSVHQSPNFKQGAFQSSPGHSRHASLGPESAAYPQGQNHMGEWNMMAPQFQGHRRSPSEYSEVSVSSAAPSPNLGHLDSFDNLDHHHSPNLSAGNDAMYDPVLGIGNFSLSDHGSRSPGRGLSPAHSPAISPRLGPQQPPNMQNQNQFMLGVNNGFGAPQMYGQNSEYPQMNHNGSVDMGQAQQMVPPEINVEFAPTSRTNSFEPPKPISFDNDALTPPDRGLWISKSCAVW